MSEDERETPVLVGNWTHFSADDVVHIQLAALRQYLAGNKTADECAQDIAATVPQGMVDEIATNDPDDSEDDDETLRSVLEQIMNNLQYTALRNPQHQVAIIELLHAIKRLPSQVVQTHEGADPRAIIWASLPYLKALIISVYDDEHYDFLKSPDDPAVIESWASCNAWIARLVSTDLYGPRGLDNCMHRASQNFIYVLDIGKHSKLAGAMAATVNLFRYASPVLLRMCRNRTRGPDPPIGIHALEEYFREPGKMVYFRGLGFRMDRWHWWKVRWEQLSRGDVNSPVRRSARIARIFMLMAENRST